MDHYVLLISSKDTPILHKQLLQAFNNDASDPLLSNDWQVNVGEESTLVILLSHPSVQQTVKRFRLLFHQKYLTWKYIDTDEDFLLPLLIPVVKTSDIYNQIPSQHQYCKSWIFQVENEQPTQPKDSRMLSIFYNVQKSCNSYIRLIELTLTRALLSSSHTWLQFQPHQ